MRTYENVSQALYHREVLENAGIQARVTRPQGKEPLQPDELPHSGGPVLLRVFEQDAQAAGEVLQEYIDDQMDGNPSVL